MSELIERVEGFFGAKGEASKALENYRERPQQVAMAKAVAQAVESGHHLVVEAGTGVGKSFGYLVPALLAALSANKRVVVSTQTISLQEQLLKKDVPLLQSCLGEPFSVRVAKGRGNYLSPRRLEVAIAEAGEARGREVLATELGRIGRELSRGREGTRQELFPGPQYEAWDLARSDTQNCLGKNCSHFEDGCWFHQARRQVFTADLVIANHALLLADLAMRDTGNRLLPEYDVVIFDEAHSLEALAREQFGFRFSRRELYAALSKLYRPSRRQGLLQFLHGAELARAMVSEVARAAEQFFGEAALLAGRDGTRELTPDDLPEDVLSESLVALSTELGRLVREASGADRKKEIEYHAARLDDMVSTLSQVLTLDESARVNWVERGRNRDDVELHAKPLEVRDFLQKKLFDEVGSAILTSATLSVGAKGGLSFFAKTLGCPDAKQLQLGSPFDFQNRVKLRIPTYLDEPRPGDDYEERAALAVLHYIERTQGGAFVLFTSYAFLNRILDRVRERLNQLGFPILAQGQGMARGTMIEEFVKDERSVLFGTDSFWQGVDVKGDALRLVIITRLPFPVPSLPLNKARARRIEKNGGNAFRELSLPEAIIRFKQGFGRLIRTEEDAGTVVVLDTRLRTKFYGSKFLAAIPSVPVFED
ncbi:MAG: helicase C-terminal domain-containing protein [Planctomycetota bacterium]